LVSRCAFHQICRDRRAPTESIRAGHGREAGSHYDSPRILFNRGVAHWLFYALPCVRDEYRDPLCIFSVIGNAAWNLPISGSTVNNRQARSSSAVAERHRSYEMALTRPRLRQAPPRPNDRRLNCLRGPELLALDTVSIMNARMFPSTINAIDGSGSAVDGPAAGAQRNTHRITDGPPGRMRRGVAFVQIVLPAFFVSADNSWVCAHHMNTSRALPQGLLRDVNPLLATESCGQSNFALLGRGGAFCRGTRTSPAKPDRLNRR